MFHSAKWQLKMIFGASVSPGLSISKNMTQLYFLLEIFPRNKSNLIVTLTNAELKRMIFPETTIWEVEYFGSYFNQALWIIVTELSVFFKVSVHRHRKYMLNEAKVLSYVLMHTISMTEADTYGRDEYERVGVALCQWPDWKLQQA